MNFREIVMSRYATKSFNGNVISDEQINKLIELIRHAPTSFNVQPWKVKLVRDDETKEQLRAASWNQPQIASCSHLFVFCANTDLDKLVDRPESQLTEAGLPAETVDGFVGMIRQFIGGLDATARLSWAQRQVYIALTNGINGAKSLGFDSCPMEGFEPDQYATILDLPPHLVPTG